MLTEAERKELDALKAKTDPTDDEKARLDALMKKAGDSGSDKTYSEAYVKKLREESAKYRTRAKEADEKLAAYDGIDPEEYKILMDAKEEAEKNKLKAEGKWDELRQQIVDEHTKELTQRDAAEAALKSQIDQLQNELNATILSHEIAVQAAVAEAINPELVEMVVKTKTKVELLEDGKRAVKVLDAKGGDRMDLKTGEDFTIALLLNEMKAQPEYAHLFKGGKVGAGSGTNLFNGKAIPNPWKKETENLTMQGRILTQDANLARRLKDEAGVR